MDVIYIIPSTPEPSPPVNVTITQTTCNSITVHWTPPVDNGNAEITECRYDKFMTLWSYAHEVMILRTTIWWETFMGETFTNFADRLPFAKIFPANILF